jgi:hypothetical protein
MASEEQTEPSDANTVDVELAETAELAPEDFYFDGPYMVFTSAYHWKRGYCCNSDCLNCPYK